MRTLLIGFALCGCLWAADPHRIYSHAMNPREHPDDTRRPVRPPDWETFGGATHFTTLRGFEIKDGQIVNFKAELEKYTRTYDLGDVIWPSYPILFASNLGDLADEIKARNLFLFDVWGYVPGSGPGGYWQQFQPPAGVFPMLESKLGDRWLGMDNGEQDGRYIGGYAGQMDPSSAPRFQQYLNFQRHFERLTGELGNRMSTLVSLNFGHYFLKEGIYTLIGAETAQALPNSQVYYAFIRGAGKQYGVPWFGNASVYNRWGFKSYGDEGEDHGPRKGSSLSLLKRLLYSHILYNGVSVGFEAGWFEGDHLSPLGRIQQSAQRWVRQNGQPGTMLTPVAVMVDFYSGWSFPRHLYSSNVYRVWGNLPYEKGDYLTDLVLDMLYPRYQDSSYFHDESGFASATPYGDSADCLVSDAPGWLLARYPVLVVAGDLNPGAEIRDRLADYARQSGKLIISANNARNLGGLAGVPHTVIADPEAQPGVQITKGEDRPLPKPYRLRPDARAALDAAFRSQALFEAGDGLSLITCRRAPGDYTLGIANNAYVEKPYRIVSHCGAIESIQELPLDQSEKTAVGHLPEGFEHAIIGASGDRAIAGGDVRIFRVRVREESVTEIPHVFPPSRPHGRILPLRDIASIKEAVLARPTFFQHYDGASIDWRYLAGHERSALEREGQWIRRQKMRIVVNLSSGANLYADLRLVDNLPEHYQASMAAVEDVLSKMPPVGATDLILPLHRIPENNVTDEETWASFETTVRSICSNAAAKGITVHLRTGLEKPPHTIQEAVDFVRRVGAKNLKIAPNLASLISKRADPRKAAQELGEMLGFWLASTPASDAAGTVWNTHGAIAGSEGTIAFLKASAAPVIFDVVYRDQDEEYLDARALERSDRQ
ncbi:MAG: hypothetical protein U0Q18_34705 [Bryobacteraceae bacterium]